MANTPDMNPAIGVLVTLFMVSLWIAGMVWLWSYIGNTIGRMIGG